MYLIINGTQYPDIQRYRSGGAITYTGASLTGIETLGELELYRDDGFHMLTDNASDYPYQTITDGTIVLLKTEPAPPEPQISDDEAVAIITDTLTTREALNIITGGNDE